MKKTKWFTFNPEKETFIAIIVGLIVIGLSLLMNADFKHDVLIGAFLIRDLMMIFGIGVAFVIIRINKIGNFKEFGIKKDKLWLAIIINIVLAATLVFIMGKALDLSTLHLDSATIFKILFILLAGVFECLFFYTYQRVVFEKAFGKTAAIFLCSVFYSFHHAGFQPEFIKLFFVGISFVLVVVLTNNILSIFPFYWSVGAVLDVLVQSEVVSTIDCSMARSFVLIGLMAAFVIVFLIKRNKNTNKSFLGNNIEDTAE